MAHFKPEYKNPGKYTNDQVARVSMEKFIAILKANHSKMKWSGSRSIDTLRLSAEIGGININIAHLVPKGHKDYKSSSITGIYTGNGPEGFSLRISDRWKTFGRSMIVDDWFDKESSFFPEMLIIFEEISTGVEFVSPKESGVNRLGQYQALAQVGEIISNL